MAKPEILVVSNLYPLPWEPNRATFNKQQFDRLAELYSLKVLVPVAWPDYWRHRKQILSCNTESLRYICYWYTPKMLYNWFLWFMYFSLRVGASGWLKNKPDLIFASWAYPDGASAAKWASKLDLPMILKVHGSDINILASGGARRKKIAEACRASNRVVAVSQALKQKLVEMGVEEESISVIYNGVDAQHFYRESSAGKEDYLLYVGNLKVDKGVIDLIEAYNRYRQGGGRLNLKVIGAGGASAKMREMLSQAGLSGYVEMLGAMKHHDVAPYVRSARALLLPSYHEGVPNVLLEASACGIPVLSTKVGGIPEVVIEGKTGVLVEPGDIEALAEGMTRVGDSQQWQKDQIVAHAKKFDWIENIQQLKHVIDTVLEIDAVDTEKERSTYERV